MRRPRRAVAAGSVALLASCASTHEAVKPAHAAANFDPTMPMYVACSRFILTGSVVGVRSAGARRMLTTIDVTSWVKPPSGPSRVDVTTADIAHQGVYERWPPGTKLRLVVTVDPDSLPSWQLSEQQFALLRRAVPESTALTCPYGPS